MSDHRAYLIRLWREDEQAPWRGKLIIPQSGEERFFATADQLLTFLTVALETNATVELENEPTKPQRRQSPY
jgi:hypothetical protein